MAPAPIASTRYERRLDAAAAAGSRLAAGFARAARAARAAVPAADARAAALVDVAAGVAAPMLVVLRALAARGRRRARDRPDPLPRPRRPGAARDRAPPGAAALSGIDCRYLAASRQIWTRAISASPTTTGSGTATGPAPRSRTCCGGWQCPAPPSPPSSRRWGSPRPPGRDRSPRPRSSGCAPGSRAPASPPPRRRRAPPTAGASSPISPRRGCSTPGPAAIVDLGWSGSLHNSLSRLLAEEGATPVDCYLFAIERVKDATWLARRRGFFFDANRGEGADIFARAEDRRGFLEVFCAADHGTVTGLREMPDGRIEAEVDPGWAGPVAAWGLRRCARRSRPSPRRSRPRRCRPPRSARSAR